MRSEDDLFLTAVSAAPWDDLPRLVYADWLDDRGGPGDAERAEFIRLHCERWRTQERRRYPRPMKERIAGLRAANEAVWRAALPILPGVEWGRYWRGFVSEARFSSPAALLEQAGAAFAACPVQFVQVSGVRPEDAEAVCRLPQLANLYGLRLDDVTLDPAVWRALTGCSWFTRLRHLIASPAEEAGAWDQERLRRNDDIVRQVLAAATKGQGRLVKVHMALPVWDVDGLEAEARGRVVLDGLTWFEPL
jgi:uncharacterized protein (TIGR02996 family)